MITRRIGLRTLLAAVAVAGATLVGTALAGPPLICFQYDNGGAKSLPWKDGREADPTYSRDNLVKDTLDLLKTEHSTIARMETLRRAALYSADRPQLATELLAKMSWIALDAEANGKPSAEAWFNPGFFAATINQLGIDINWKPGVADGAVGYAWIKKALALDGEDPGMQFAAALVTFEHSAQTQHKEHLRKALAGVKPGTPLARSMEANWALGHKSIEEMRKDLGITEAAKR